MSLLPACVSRRREYATMGGADNDSPDADYRSARFGARFRAVGPASATSAVSDAAREPSAGQRIPAELWQSAIAGSRVCVEQPPKHFRFGSDDCPQSIFLSPTHVRSTLWLKPRQVAAATIQRNLRFPWTSGFTPPPSPAVTIEICYDGAGRVAVNATDGHRPPRCRRAQR